jgi:hypothetical protein
MKFSMTEQEKSDLLRGLLGSGKSQLALKYGCIFREDHLGGLCWRIACQSTLTLLNSLKRLADALGLVGKDNTKQNENISNDESLISLQRLILIELRKSVDGIYSHILKPVVIFHFQVILQIAIQS